MQRISTRLTDFLRLIGFGFLALTIYFATSPALTTGRGVLRRLATPQERWFMVAIFSVIAIYALWYTFSLYHVQRGKQSFVISRLGLQKTIRFQNIITIQTTKLSSITRPKTVYIKYLDEHSKPQTIIFQAARSLIREPFWLEELQEVLHQPKENLPEYKSGRTF